jgi:biofilm PGA synthesis N-glycosyltransferase PgaC
MSATTMLSYAVVTPARDERDNLDRLARSMAAQTILPTHWVIADDGSVDGTVDLAEAWAREHAWIRLLRRPQDSGRLANGRREARDLHAFRDGIKSLDEIPAIVVKVDADTSFDPDYFERVLQRFASEPDLGIAGGACYELEDGHWVRQKVDATHPRGASRAYRRDCLDIVMTIDAHMGWDGLDEVKAALRGYRSATLLELGFRHHRLVGHREKGRLHNGTAQGRAAWYMGYRPSYVVLRTIYRMAKDPGAVGMILGYAMAMATRQPRCTEPDVRRYVQRRQRLTALIRRGTPP